MGKRGPKPSGRVKTLVSLRPAQLAGLRMIAGHLAASYGEPVDVSRVLRAVIDSAPLFFRLNREAVEQLERMATAAASTPGSEATSELSSALGELLGGERNARLSEEGYAALHREALQFLRGVKLGDEKPGTKVGAKERLRKTKEENSAKLKRAAIRGKAP